MRRRAWLPASASGVAFIATASAAVTVAVWLLMAAGVPVSDPAVFYFPVVILGTLWFTWRVAALGIVLAVLLSNYFLTEPFRGIAPVNLAEAVTDVIIVISNGLVVLITASLKRARTEAERLARENRELYLQEAERRQAVELFMGVLSHDLRTPLTVLKGRVQLARRAPRHAAADEGGVLEIVEEQIDRLVEILDRLLDFQRLQQGAVTLEKAPVELVAWLRAVLQRVGLLYPEHTFRLHAEVDELWAEADAPRLETAVTNLLTNAAKYSPNAPVVDVTVLRRNAHAAIAVQDHGIGMTADEQRRLFAPFYRTDSARQAGIKGTGLGLYTARQIIELHGGSIEVASQAGVGTTFTCVLPLAAPPRPPATSPNSPAGGRAGMQADQPG